MFLLNMFKTDISFFSNRNFTEQQSVANCSQAPSSCNASPASCPQFNSTLIPLDILVDDVAAIVLGYADDSNVTISANMDVQKIYSKDLVMFLSKHKNLFQKNSIENLQQKKVVLFEEILDLCNARLSKIESRMVQWDPDYEDTDPHLFEFLDLTKTIKAAIDSPSIHTKIDALKTSIPFLENYSFFSIMLSSYSD